MQFYSRVVAGLFHEAKLPDSQDHAAFGPLDYALDINSGRAERVVNHESHAKSIAASFIAAQSGLAGALHRNVTPEARHACAPRP